MPNVNIGGAIEITITWVQNLAPWLFDFIAQAVALLINLLYSMLLTPPWWVMALAIVIVSFWKNGWKLAVFVAIGFTIIESMDLWQEAMETLGLVLLAALIATVLGLPLGVWAGKSESFRRVIRPVLDLMQTLPVFVYLIPAVTFFGIGLVPAVIATVIFATAPVIRLVELGIREVDNEMVEASVAFGARSRQTLWNVQLPLAMPSIMTGINQTIMLSLSMVVIAGMVGAGGLGAVVFQGISALDIGTGFEGGIGVVFIAILLDRLASMPAKRRRGNNVEPPGKDKPNIVSMEQEGTMAQHRGDPNPVKL